MRWALHAANENDEQKGNEGRPEAEKRDTQLDSLQIRQKDSALTGLMHYGLAHHITSKRKEAKPSGSRIRRLHVY